MIVNEKNEGKKISYRVEGNFLFLGADDDLALNLKKYEREAEKQVDVTMDLDGMLLVGTGQDGYYIAQVTIPAKNGDFSMDKCVLDLWSTEVPVNEETKAGTTAEGTVA